MRVDDVERARDAMVTRYYGHRFVDLANESYLVSHTCFAVAVICSENGAETWEPCFVAQIHLVAVTRAQVHRLRVRLLHPLQCVSETVSFREIRVRFQDEVGYRFRRAR